MNLMLPLVRPLERLVPPPLGMSLIGIFRKNQMSRFGKSAQAWMTELNQPHRRTPA
jgi:hypothetical protein